MSNFKLAIVGDCYGEAEEQWNRSFVGPAGDELSRILGDAGLLKEECYLTNVFNQRPANDKIESFFAKKGEAELAPGVPAFGGGLYLRANYHSELVRLHAELKELSPNLVVLLGSTAVWAVLGAGSIGKIRGTCCVSSILPGVKCLPTYHPDSVRKQYDLRHVTVLDFTKAKREREFPELRRPVREIWVDVSLDDILVFYERFLRDAPIISADIETAGDQITCIGFAGSIDRAISILFVDPRKPSGNYWPTLAEELEAWKLVDQILNCGARILGQNFNYDMQHLWQTYGVPIPNFAEDTMLLHHALQPESEKGLGFLGSVYTNETAWKTERPRGKSTIKRED